MLRLALRPRWLLRHVLALVLVAGCCVAARWQFHRALHRHSILNWSYTLEWSLFAGFVLLCWGWFLRDEARGPQPDDAPAAAPAAATPMLPPPSSAAIGSTPVLPPAPTVPIGGTPVLPPAPAVAAEQLDPELAAYNAYLADLHARGRQ